MDFRLLGPIEVVGDGDVELRIGTGRQRALLGLLVLHANEAVSRERLVDELWGSPPPPTAHKMLHNQVSSLRQTLGRNGRLETLGSAYRLNVEHGELDVDRFEALLTAGRAQLHLDPEAAAATLRRALALWRGPPLADLAHESFAQPEIGRLEERRSAAFEARVEAELTLGRHADLVSELEAAVAREPLREHLRAQLMLALYRCGRQADALEEYRRARGTLVQEIGVEPGAELRSLHAAILDQDPELDATWARRRAVAAGAERIAAGREALRIAEDALSDDVEALPRERAATPAAAICPFPGLAAFDAAHAEYFFGRERLVAELIARLVGAPLLAVIGPSGSGKSSVLRAGLLPALADGVLPGSDRWSRALLRPGDHPMAELERALRATEGRTVLAVDQFEEAFTHCRDEAERTAFLDALVTPGDRRIEVVIAIRADFYGRCAEHDRLAWLVGANQVLVGPMRREDLRRSIEEPARRVGLTVEPALTEALIADVADEPGGLPLLSAALLEQWREREGREMRHAAYERTGGVRGAVARLAERTYTGLSEPEQLAAKRLLLRLADTSEPQLVRRRAPVTELDADRDADTAAALAALTDGRLVTVADGTVEVAHEALLREWPRLRTWLEEDAEGLRVHQHLMQAARNWDAAGRDPGELYRGARLAGALDWTASHGGDLNALETSFVDASRAAAEAEGDRQRRANRRLRVQLAGLAAVLALAIGAGAVALHQRGEARDAVVVADAQRLGVEASHESRLDQALLFARAAVALDDSPTTRGNLLGVLMRDPAALGVVDYGWQVYGAGLSPDGRLMALGDERGAVAFLDAATRRPAGRPYRIEGGIVQNVTFSPDGRTLAVSYMLQSDRAQYTGRLDLVDVRTRKARLRLVTPPLTEPSDYVFTDVVFLPGGDLLVRPVNSGTPGGAAAPMYRVDGETGKRTGSLQVGRHATNYYASAADGRVFITSARDGRTWEVDPERLRVTRSWPVGDFSGAVSPDGRYFALGSLRGDVRLLDLASGRVLAMEKGHDDRVSRMRFTPDSRTLVTTGDDGRVLAWDVATRTIAQRFPSHQSFVDGLDMTRDGRTLLTGSADTRAVLWDLAGDRRLDRHFSIGGPFDVDFTPRGLAISPDGKTLAVTRPAGEIGLIDTDSLRERRVLRTVDGPAAAVVFSPDGKTLAVTGPRGRVSLWDSRTLAPAGAFAGVAGESQALAYSPDGDRLAVGEVGVGQLAPLKVWDVRRRAPASFRGQSAANSMAFSPDGSVIAAAAGAPGTSILDAETGRLLRRLDTGDDARSVAFSPDGKLLFVGQYDGRGILVSTDDWKPVGAPEQAHRARITTAVFTHDSRTLVTAGADGTVVIWDVATRKPLGSPLKLAPGTFASAVVSPDGTRLYAVSTRGEGVEFDLSPEHWERHACQVAGHGLTPAEWRDAVPSRPYRAIC